MCLSVCVCLLVCYVLNARLSADLFAGFCNFGGEGCLSVMAVMHKTLWVSEMSLYCILYVKYTVITALHLCVIV